MSGNALHVLVTRSGAPLATKVFPEGVYLVGSDPSSDLVLDDPGVAPLHLQLQFGGGQVLVVDDEDAGVQVNGQPAQVAPVATGDRIGVGPFVLEVRLQGVRKPAPRLQARPTAARKAPPSLAPAPPPPRAAARPPPPPVERDEVDELFDSAFTGVAPAPRVARTVAVPPPPPADISGPHDIPPLLADVTGPHGIPPPPPPDITGPHGIPPPPPDITGPHDVPWAAADVMEPHGIPPPPPLDITGPHGIPPPPPPDITGPHGIPPPPPPDVTGPQDVPWPAAEITAPHDVPPPVADITAPHDLAPPAAPPQPPRAPIVPIAPPPALVARRPWPRMGARPPPPRFAPIQPPPQVVHSRPPPPVAHGSAPRVASRPPPPHVSWAHHAPPVVVPEPPPPSILAKVFERGGFFLALSIGSLVVGGLALMLRPPPAPPSATPAAPVHQVFEPMQPEARAAPPPRMEVAAATPLEAPVKLSVTAADRAPRPPAIKRAPRTEPPARRPAAPGGGRRVASVQRTPKPPKQGRVDGRAINRIIDKHIDGIRNCYERALSANPHMSEGELQLEWTITADGRVTGVDAKNDSIAVPDMVECLGDLLRRLRFPRPAGGPAVVSHFFQFRQAG